MATENPEDPPQDEVSDKEMSVLANSLASSQEAMNVLGSALAGQVVGALKAQGLLSVPAQPPPTHGGQPALRSDEHPYHMMGPRFDDPIQFRRPAHASTGYGMAPPFFPPPGPAPYGWHAPVYTQGPSHAGFDSPFDRLGPPSHARTESRVVYGSDPGSSHSSRPGSSSCLSEAGEEEGEEEEEEEEGDAISLHPDWDIDLEPGRGLIDENLKTFVKQCVQSPLTNQQRKKALDKYPLPDVTELRPPKLDMTMKLLVGKPVSSHDGWLQKMQALCTDAYAPLLAILNESKSDNQPTADEMSSAVKCSLKLMGNVFARLTKERRRKALLGIHKDLAHMADEEFKQSDVLFGEDVVERVKKRHDALRTLKTMKQPFQRGGAQKKNRFGRRENQGYPQQSRFKPGLYKRPKFSFHQKGQQSQAKRD